MNIQPMDIQVMDIQAPDLQVSSRQAPNQQVPKLQEQNDQMQNRVALLRSGLLRVTLLRRSGMVWLAGIVITAMSLISLLKPLPAMAMASPYAPGFYAVATVSTVATMPNKAKAVAKDTEGKLESAYGDLTWDKGRQIKGAAKQVQASGMNAGEDIKEGAKSLAKKVGDATR